MILRGVATRPLLKLGMYAQTSALRSVQRRFCAPPPQSQQDVKKTPVVDDIDPDSKPANEKVQTIIQVDQQTGFQPKIMTEIVKDQALEEPEEVKPDKVEQKPKVEVETKPTVPAQPVPEKDKAFQEKKKTIWQIIKVELIHLKKSLIQVWKDTKYISKMVYKNRLNEDNYTLKQIHDRRQISKDLVKFIPYTFFIVVPGAEFLIPPYLMMFPNSTPTQFIKANSLGDRKKVLAEKQSEGYNLFVKTLPRFGNVLGIDPVKLFEYLSYLQSSEGREKERLIYRAQDFETRVREFLEDPRRKQLERDLDLSKLTSYELEQLCKFFYFEYIPGTNLINLALGILKLPLWVMKHITKYYKQPNYNRFINNPFYKFKFTLDNGPLQYIKKYLLLWQLRLHIKQLRKQDRVLSRNPQELAIIPQMQRVDFARERGIRIEPNHEIVKYVEEFWLPLSQRRDIPDDVLVWIAVLRYKYTNILV